MSETDLVKKILVALCKNYPSGLWYRRNVGAVQAEERFIKFGLPGQADLAGIFAGKAFEVEAKHKTKQTPAQADWQRAVERAGGVYILTKSVEDCLSKIAAALNTPRI